MERGCTGFENEGYTTERPSSRCARCTDKSQTLDRELHIGKALGERRIVRHRGKVRNHRTVVESTLLLVRGIVRMCLVHTHHHHLRFSRTLIGSAFGMEKMQSFVWYFTGQATDCVCTKHIFKSLSLSPAS